MSTQENKQGKSLLSRLRVAVQKVKLLLSATILSHTWHATTLLRGLSSMNKRQISFNDKPGLMICASPSSSSSSSEESSSGDNNNSEGLVSPSWNSCTLQRTISYPSSDDDIDKRAEMFITNFRRQLQMERQISLQLRYCRENSLELLSP